MLWPTTGQRTRKKVDAVVRLRSHAVANSAASEYANGPSNVALKNGNIRQKAAIALTAVVFLWSTNSKSSMMASMMKSDQYLVEGAMIYYNAGYFPMMW
jgi:hypothetical protein